MASRGKGVKEIRVGLRGGQPPRLGYLPGVDGVIQATSDTSSVPGATLRQLWWIRGTRCVVCQARDAAPGWSRGPLLDTVVLSARADGLLLSHRWRRPADDDPPGIETLLAALAWADVPVRTHVRCSGVTVRAFAADSAPLRDLLAKIEDRRPDGVEVAVERCGTVCVEGADLPELRDRDVRLARLALDLGYYDDPKGCGIRDIAGRSGLSKSTVSRVLRSVEARAVGLLAGSGPRDRPLDMSHEDL